jgi:hypothetical protein
VECAWEVFRDLFIQDASPEAARSVWERLVPQPFAPWAEKLDLREFYRGELPRSYIAVADDRALPGRGPTEGACAAVSAGEHMQKRGSRAGARARASKSIYFRQKRAWRSAALPDARLCMTWQASCSRRPSRGRAGTERASERHRPLQVARRLCIQYGLDNAVVAHERGAAG